MCEQARPLGCLEVADYYVRQGLAAGIDDLTNMKLNKLVFIAHGWHLGYYGSPLVMGPLQAWKLGPVFPELYYWIKFKLMQQGKPLSAAVAQPDFFFSQDADVSESLKILDHVFKVYFDESASRLVDLTLKGGSPWWRTVIHGWPSIPDDVIQDYYARRIKS